MSVSNTSLRSPSTGGYACNGSVTDFAGTFNLLAEGDVDVILTDSSGNETTLVLTTNYTVAPTGGSYPCTAFTVTTVATYSSDYTITLIRNMDYTQPTTYGNAGPYYPKTHETSYDRLLMQVQQLKEITDRCVKYNPSTDIDSVTIVIDSTGTAITSYLQDGVIVTSHLADNAVTYAKMQNVSATDKLLGRSTAGAGNVEEIACTSAGRALLDDASAADQRTTLGLGTIATQNANAVAITGGTISGSVIETSGVLSTDELYYIREEQTSGTDAGTFTSGAWRTRVLNTEVVANITGASLSTNVITLPAGEYYVEASAPAESVEEHKIKLRQTSATASDIIIGTSEDADATDSSSTRSFLSGKFTIAEEETFELQHWANSTQITHGLGRAVSITNTAEVYAEIKIWKVG